MAIHNQANARLMCHSSEIGEKLSKLAKRFPKSKNNILAHSERLAAISTSLLSLLPTLSGLPSKDRIIAQHHLGRCFRFIHTLYCLQELLDLCAGDSKLRPVLIFLGKPLDPLGQDGHLHLQQELNNAEESILQAVYSMRILITHNGKLVPDLELLFENVASRLHGLSPRARIGDPDSYEATRTLAFIELLEPKAPTLPHKQDLLPSMLERREVYLPGIRLLQVKSLVVPLKRSVNGPLPNITTLSWIEQDMQHSFDISPSQFFKGIGQEISYFESLQKSQSSYQDGLPDRLFNYNWNREAQSSAGKLLLHEVLMTSYNHGRIKEREVLLFQNRLLFLRRKGATEVIIWDISLSKDLILVAYNPGDSLLRTNFNGRALTLYWKTGLAEQCRISGVKIFFDEMKTLQLWGSFLALHSPMKQSPKTSSNTPAPAPAPSPSNVLEASITPQSSSLLDSIPLKGQGIVDNRRGIFGTVRNTVSRFTKRHVI